MGLMLLSGCRSYDNFDRELELDRIYYEFDLPEEICDENISVQYVDTEKSKSDMENFSINLSQKDMEYLGFSQEENALYFINSDKEKYFDSIFIYDIKNENSFTVDLGEKYLYHAERISDSLEIAASNAENEFSIIKINAAGDFTKKDLGTYDSISASSFDGGFVFVSENIEEFKNKTKIDSKLEVINDDDRKKLDEKSTLMDIYEGKPRIIEGAKITTPNIIEDFIGYQNRYNLDLTSEDGYKSICRLENLSLGDCFEVAGLSEYCIYFSGDWDFFLAITSPEKYENLPGEKAQNGFLFLGEDNAFKKFEIPEYENIKNVSKVLKIDDDNILVHADNFLDLMNLKEKKITRIKIDNFENTFVDFSRDTVSFAEIKKDNSADVYIGKIKNIY